MKIKFYSILFLTLSLCTPLSIPSLLAADEQVNADDSPIISFSDARLHSEKRPGTWKDILSSNLLKFKPLRIKEGLETIMMLTISVTPFESEKAAPIAITDIYIADYQDIILVHQTYTPASQPGAAEFRLNGILNFVQIYLVDNKRGVFKKELRF